MSIHANATDVVVITTAACASLQSCDIWTAFGQGAKRRFLACHCIATTLGHEDSMGLLFLRHALTGWDLVSVTWHWEKTA